MRQYVLIETQFLPPISTFGIFLNSEGVCFEMQENYQKRSFRNRCHLLGPNGVVNFSVPLAKGKNQKKNIRDVKIAYEYPWITHFLNTIKSCYGSAPFFPFIFEGVKSNLMSKPIYLTELNIMIYFNILDFLGVSISTASSNFFEKKANPEFIDLRNQLSPNKNLSNLLPSFPKYGQVFSDRFPFMANLSILDLLFCLGPEAVPYLKNIGEMTIRHFKRQNSSI